MFQLFYSTAVVQQLSLLIVSSAFLFLGLNVAVAWGQTQLTTKTSISKTATPRKATYHSVKKTSTKASVSHQSLYPRIDVAGWRIFRRTSRHRQISTEKVTIQFVLLQNNFLCYDDIPM